MSLAQKSMKKHVPHAITGFELQKIALHNLKHWGLKPQTKTVLWVLIDCYNPENGSVVFPSMEYIAELGAMGLTSAKAGIKELINKGLIIKSKRSKVNGNYNKYLLTPKVQISASEQSENEFLKQSDSDRFILTNKTRINKKQTTEKKVVVSFKNSITLDEIPQIIKDKKHIENPCGYWASLSEEVKKGYWQKQKKLEEKQKEREIIIKKQREIEKKEKEEQTRQEAENNKPFKEQYTYYEACNIIKKLANVDKSLAHRGIAKKLAAEFEIDIEMLLSSET